MQGSNSLNFNENTMKKIVQYYFDNELFKDGQSPTVCNVSSSAKFDNNFSISVCEKTESEMI